MKAIGCLTFFILGLSIATLGHAQMQSIPKETEELEFATELLSQADYQSAASMYEDFIRQNPHSSLLPNAYVGAGDSHFFLKEPNRALDFYERYENQFPQGKDRWLVALREAQCLYQKGDKQGVIKKLCAINPSTVKPRFQQTYYFYLASAYMDQNDFKSAADNFKKVLSLKSTGDYATIASLRLATIMEHNGDQKDAVSMYNDAVQGTDADNPQMQAKIALVKGQAFLQAKQYDVAAITFQDIVDGYPDIPEAKDAAINWFICLLDMKQDDTLISEYTDRFKDNFDSPSDGKIHLLAVDALLREQRRQDALDILNNVISTPSMGHDVRAKALSLKQSLLHTPPAEQPKPQEVLFQQAYALQSQGNVQKAADLYENIIQQHADPQVTLMALKNIAIIYGQQNKEDKAAQAMNTIVLQYPHNDLPTENYLWLAEYWQKKNNLDNMKRVLNMLKQRPADGTNALGIEYFTAEADRMSNNCVEATPLYQSILAASDNPYKDGASAGVSACKKASSKGKSSTP